MVNYYDKILELYPTLMKEWMKLADYEPWLIMEDVSLTRVKNAINSFNHLDESITKNLTLLDIGCECGVYSVLAAQKFKKVIGIENNEIAYKRGLKTKDIFTKNGYDVSNLQFKHIDFREYIESNEYKKDKVDSILAFEVLNTFHCKVTHHWEDTTEMDLFDSLLKNVKLIMIQSKLKEKNQWEWDSSQYVKHPATYEDGKSNSYHLYAKNEIKKYLDSNNFKTKIYPKNSNCSVVLGVSNG